MTDLERKIKEAEKNFTALMNSKEWQQSVEESDQKIEEALEKLKRISMVDPKLLDEPATL